MIARAQVLVDVTPEEAFRLFTDEIGMWWRRDSRYWNDPERALGLRLEPRVGGRFVELYDDDHFELGRVTAWEPGERLGVTWTQEGWPDGMATDVEVTFAPADGGTLVRLEHSGFEGLGDAAEQAVAGYTRGWDELLGWFAEHARAGRPA